MKCEKSVYMRGYDDEKLYLCDCGEEGELCEDCKASHNIKS